jgi:hypothetical protein
MKLIFLLVLAFGLTAIAVQIERAAMNAAANVLVEARR